jgi:hypothetical protein
MPQVTPRPPLLSMSRPSFDKSDRLIALETRLLKLCRSWDALRYEQRRTDERLAAVRAEVARHQRLIRRERHALKSAP